VEIDKSYKEARALLDAGDCGKAFNAYLETLKLLPKWIRSLPDGERRGKANEMMAVVLNDVGFCLHSMDRTREGMEICEKALAHTNEPATFAEINRNLYPIYVKLGDMVSAQDAFRNSKLFKDEMLPEERRVFKGKHIGLPADKCLAEIKGILDPLV
jgi:tetratricopeptide (TPR) repeat protein